MKCDEAKPTCKNCLRIGRSCDGKPSGAVGMPLQSRELKALTPLHASSSAKDKQLFSFFCGDTVDIMAGDFDRSFWIVNLPQLSQVHLALWHAALAMSAFMTKSHITGTADVDRQSVTAYHSLAKMHYGASVRHLFDLASEADLDTGKQEMVLAVVILLGSLSAIDFDMKTTVLHLWNGNQLLQKWQPAVTDEASATARGLTPPYGELARMYTNLYQQYIVSWEQYHMLQASPRLEQALAGIKWACETNQEASTSVSICPLIIRIWGKNGDVELHISLGSVDLAYDQLTSRLRTMILHAQDIVFGWIMGHTHQGTVSILTSIDEASFRPVYKQGQHCSSHSKRNTMVRIPTRWPVKSGFWDSRMLAMNIQRGVIVSSGRLHWVDPIHLGGCSCRPGSFTCHEHRMTSVDIPLLQDGGMHVILKAVGEVAEDRHVHVIDLIW